MKSIVLVVICYYIIIFQTESIRVMVWNIHICNETNHTLKGAYELKNITGGFRARGSVFMTEDFGDDNKYLCQVFKYSGNKRRILLALEDKGACDALNKYGGFYWQIVERFGGVERPGVCPVPQKTYNVPWASIDFSAISLMKMAPNGKFHISCTLFDKTGKLIKACGSLDASVAQ